VEDRQVVGQFSKWSQRSPDAVFDDNATWIQVLGGRVMMGNILGSKSGVNAEMMAKWMTKWHVQVANGML
jgi:hypothetical protein